MKELSVNTRKRLIWLLAEARKSGGKTTIQNNTTLPGFNVRIWHDDDNGAELLVHEGNHYLDATAPWAFRVIILKNVLLKELPCYPAMWRDTDNGLNHVIKWVEEGEEPELIQPIEFYDEAVQLIQSHVSRLWRVHNLPALKDEHVEAN